MLLRQEMSEIKVERGKIFNTIVKWIPKNCLLAKSVLLLAYLY